MVARGTEGDEANGDFAGSAHVLYVDTHAEAARPNKHVEFEELMDVDGWRLIHPSGPQKERKTFGVRWGGR